MRHDGSRRGSILIVTLALTLFLTSLVGGYLYAVAVFTADSGWSQTDAQVLWLAEAGLQKAIWNLKTPSGSGGQGEGWTTAGTAESLGEGSYTMVVERWDFARAANGSSASDNPAQGSSSIGPAKTIDADDSTYWESAGNPGNSSPQDLIITFPSPLTVNKVRFLAPSDSTRPRDYTWEVSSDGSSYTTVVTVNNNDAADRTDTFSAQSSVTHLRLQTTQDGQGAPQRVRISTLEAIGARVTSTGTITATGQNYTRRVRQTLVADDGSPQSQVAYVQSDWTEL